ncbi:four-carbon acid sugar kinase family protein [Microbacterium sp. gxy059]|uniref:four-carbon acid sugar kinase family protein n=1 Tax=Microbacterium sp. gxy059 TaxID=2957199 RepID=UPI003D95E068
MTADHREDTASGPSLGVLAEDLQGALAVSSRLLQRGLRVAVVASRQDPIGEVDAVIVDIALRRRLEDPQLVAEEWARWLLSLGIRQIDVRIDPLLHGSPAEMTRGTRLTVGSGSPLWVVPAYPSAGRSALDGRLMFTDASGAAGDLDVRGALAIDDAVVVPLETVTAGTAAVRAAVAAHASEGADAFVFDATTERHLETIAEAAAEEIRDGVGLVSVSGGAWLRFFPDLGRDGFALLAAAGTTPVDRLQLSRVADAYASHAISLSAEEARSSSPEHLLRLFARHRIVIVQARDREQDVAAAVAADIGAAVRRLLDVSLTGSHACLGVVTSGGLTTSEVIVALEADRLLPGNELEPLCPLVRLSGGPFDRLGVASKSGSVGTSEIFVRLLRRFIGG